MLSKLYTDIKDDALDKLRVNTNPTLAEFKRAEKHLYLYMTLFYNEQNGVSNVFQIGDNYGNSK